VTLNGILAVILRYLAELVSFGAQLHQRGWSYPHTVCDKKFSAKNL